jgi:hypothetical protein
MTAASMATAKVLATFSRGTEMDHESRRQLGLVSLQAVQRHTCTTQADSAMAGIMTL